MAQSLRQLHVEFLEDLELGHGRSSKTVANYDHYLTQFFTQQNIRDIGDIDLEAIRTFRRYLSEQRQVTPATQNYHFIALRQFLKYLARRDVSALAPDKITLAKLAERDIDVLYPEEIDALLQAPRDFLAAARRGEPLNGRPVTTKDTSVIPSSLLPYLRDVAMLATFFSTGMRISELVRLDRDDIRADADEMPVRGKGNKVRVVFLAHEAKKAIAAYVDERHDTDPALFIRHNVGSLQAAHQAETDLRITPRSIQRLMKKYASAAGLTKQITPHTLRHSFATDLLSNGADVRQVQQLLGHASITTTQVYTHLTDAHLRDVHERFHRKRRSLVGE